MRQPYIRVLLHSLIKSLHVLEQSRAYTHTHNRTQQNNTVSNLKEDYIVSVQTQSIVQFSSSARGSSEPIINKPPMHALKRTPHPLRAERVRGLATGQAYGTLCDVHCHVRTRAYSGCGFIAY